MVLHEGIGAEGNCYKGVIGWVGDSLAWLGRCKFSMFGCLDYLLDLHAGAQKRPPCPAWHVGELGRQISWLGCVRVIAPICITIHSVQVISLHLLLIPPFFLQLLVFLKCAEEASVPPLPLLFVLICARIDIHCCGSLSSAFVLAHSSCGDSRCCCFGKNSLTLFASQDGAPSLNQTVVWSSSSTAQASHHS